MDSFEENISDPDPGLGDSKQERINKRREDDRWTVEQYASAHRCSWGVAIDALRMRDPDDDANYPSQVQKTIETDGEQKTASPLDRITESQSKAIEDAADAMGCSYLEAAYDRFHYITRAEYMDLLHGKEEEVPTISSSLNKPMDPKEEEKLKAIYKIIDDAINSQKGDE